MNTLFQDSCHLLSIEFGTKILIGSLDDESKFVIHLDSGEIGPSQKSGQSAPLKI
jgi:two-component system sensor histidine kinase KdpD